MAEPTASYDVSVSGLWSSRHRISADGKPVGVLEVRRNKAGMVVAGRYAPEKGEVLDLRRDPGLLRSQFSMWTEAREWLGSALRPHVLQRLIHLHTGSRPLRVMPAPGLGFGWSLVAPKTGEMARIRGNPLTRRARVEVFRKLDFELVLFAYFLGSQLWLESVWPGPSTREAPTELPAPSKATRTAGS
jgi:hypothetical protein